MVDGDVPLAIHRIELLEARIGVVLWFVAAFGIVSGGAILWLVSQFWTLDKAVDASKNAIASEAEQQIGRLLNSSLRKHACFNAMPDRPTLTHGKLITVHREGKDEGPSSFYDLQKDGTVSIKEGGVYVVSVTTVTERPDDAPPTYEIDDVQIGVVMHAKGEKFDVDSDDPFVRAWRGQGSSLRTSASGISVTALPENSVLAIEPSLGGNDHLTKVRLREIQFCLARL